MVGGGAWMGVEGVEGVGGGRWALKSRDTHTLGRSGAPTWLTMDSTPASGYLDQTYFHILTDAQIKQLYYRNMYKCVLVFYLINIFVIYFSIFELLNSSTNSAQV